MSQKENAAQGATSAAHERDETTDAGSGHDVSMRQDTTNPTSGQVFWHKLWARSLTRLGNRYLSEDEREDLRRKVKYARKQIIGGQDG